MIATQRSRRIPTGIDEGRVLMTRNIIRSITAFATIAAVSLAVTGSAYAYCPYGW